MQFDPYKKRDVPIDFTAAESCQFVWEEEEYRILFITNGKLEISLNQVSMKLRKGDILCLTNQDSFTFISSAELAAASFRFEPSFLKTIQLSHKNETFSMAPEIKSGSILFKRDPRHSGVYHASNAVYTQLLEYFFVMGTEVFAKSDSLWVCRIKKYLIQFLYLLEETSNREEQVYLDQLLSYIHTNYRKKITLAELTELTNSNRVTLNQKFRERFGCTAMTYLLNYRLKVAADLLTHTGLTVNEIAVSAGFGYETYFIKQFSAKKKVSPTTYRKETRRLAAAAKP